MNICRKTRSFDAECHLRWSRVRRYCAQRCRPSRWYDERHRIQITGREGEQDPHKGRLETPWYWKLLCIDSHQLLFNCRITISFILSYICNTTRSYYVHRYNIKPLSLHITETHKVWRDTATESISQTKIATLHIPVYSPNSGPSQHFYARATAAKTTSVSSCSSVSAVGLHA